MTIDRTVCRLDPPAPGRLASCTVPITGLHQSCSNSATSKRPFNQVSWDRLPHSKYSVSVYHVQMARGLEPWRWGFIFWAQLKLWASIQGQYLDDENYQEGTGQYQDWNTGCKATETVTARALCTFETSSHRSNARTVHSSLWSK